MTDHPIERERRWLVRDYDRKYVFRTEVIHMHIQQGYFDVLGERSFRVRVIGLGEDKHAVITLKEGSGEIRTERELPIDLAAAELMLESTPYQIEKDRARFFDGWELDSFGGTLNGITLLEYEAHGDEPIPPLPAWIHDAIDVTDSLTNLHLARMAKEICGDANEHVSRYLEPKLSKIVLTGGPCSGKSTFMRDVVEKYGHLVHCVPEVASILIAQVGILPSMTDANHNDRFQQILYRVQRSFEEAAELQAIKDGKEVIILDRGTLDAVAYFNAETNDQRQALFSIATGISVSHELKRYMAVLYLAPPSREVYEAEGRNNAARSESYEQAIALAHRTHDAWHVRCEEPWSRWRFTIADGATWNEKRDAAFKILESHISH